MPPLRDRETAPLVRPQHHGYLGPAHPLAAIAAKHCQAHTGMRGIGVGRVACGRCWERAIRDDERIAVEYDLPREIEVDPQYVDEIAVELACRGERLALTPVEQAAAIRHLSHAGLSRDRIVRRLHLSHAAVCGVLAKSAPVMPMPAPAGQTERKAA